MPKQARSHPWNVAGERVKRERITRIAQAIARMRGVDGGNGKAYKGTGRAKV